MSVTATAPPPESFRLSQLVYDTRYRGMTIQIVALFALMLAFAWLISNAIANLEALGKDFDFGFLFSTSGYDVNQRLLEYSSQSTHGRAAVMGILNTLVLALVGCITATFLGVLAGVARLSKNWIVSRLMTVYVEAFRNVPVLLWIIIVVAVVNETLPAPREFRGQETGAIIFTNRGFYFPEVLFSRGLGDWDLEGSFIHRRLVFLAVAALVFFMLRGVLINLTKTLFKNVKADSWLASAVQFIVVSIIVSVIFRMMGFQSFEFPPFKISLDLIVIVAVLGTGLFISKKIGAWADAQQASTGSRPNVLWYRLGVVFLPVILVLIVLGFHFGYAELKGFNFRGGTYVRDSFIALWIALSLYTGAFIAEAVRAGIQSVSKGQTEAAFALGIQPGRTMSLVILPQALRVIVPPLISQYLNLTKNSSLAIAVGYMDATGTLGGITLNQTGREMETILLLMAFYLVVSLTISFFMNLYNERTKLKER
ncbi:MAG: ABC transporter permease subunit [Pseudomonadota bacterium]